ITGKERAIFSQVFEQITQVQLAMSLNQLFDWQQVLLRHSKSTDRGPYAIASCKPRRAIKAAPTVRRLSQFRLLNHRLRKTNSIEVPKACHKRQQQTQSLALVHHQRLLAVPVVVHYLFRRRVANLKWIEEKGNSHRDCI